MRPLDVFSDFSRYRVCAISSRVGDRDGAGVGTGTALRHGADLYVVTCAHVAKPRRPPEELGSVTFDGDASVGHEELEVVFLDDRLDLALIRVRPRAHHLLQHVRPIHIDQLASRERFAAAQPNDGHGYAFIGLPAKYALQDRHGILFRCLAYRARAQRNDGVTKLTLGYDDVPGFDALPEPHGVSGSLVFELDALDRGEGLWTPGPAVAVVHTLRTDLELKKRELVCCPVAPILDYLQRGEPS